MSVIAVNEIEPRSGSEVSVVAGNSIAADTVRADTLSARTSTGILIEPGITFTGNDIVGQTLAVSGFINGGSVVSPSVETDIFTVVGGATLTGGGSNFTAPMQVNTSVVHGTTTITSADNIALDLTASRSILTLTLSHNPVFTFTGGSPTPNLLYINPNGSSRTLSWPGGVKWSGTALTSLTSGNLYVVTISLVSGTYVLASTEFA